MKKLIIWILVAIAAVIIIAIAVTLGVVLSRNHKPPSPSLDDIISDDATFPNGSCRVQAKSLQAGPPGMAPNAPNVSVLAQLGVKVADSNLIAETGRLNFFYIAVPTSSSTRKKRSPKDDAMVISSIGIRFGKADTINVAPLSLASKLNSGLRPVGQLQDKSTVYELQVRMPESMCAGSSVGACTMISWKPYSIFIDNSIGVSSVTSTALPVACGSQCDSPSDTPCATSTCQGCNGQQVAGANTPVTRRYNMGTTKGNVIFLYETYVVKDRITVVYENSEMLFDSKCIGTDGQRQTPIAFSGKSKELRVDVEPNCDGTTSTEWYFTLSCPDPCKDNKNKVVLMNDANEVKKSSKVYITKEAEMPPLTAYYCKDSSTTASVKWSFTMESTSGKNPNSSYCPPVTYNSTGSQWKIKLTAVQGGDATLKWTIDKGTSGELKFTILGTQPAESVVADYIRTQTTMWYAEYIAKDESPCLKQFKKDGYPVSSYDGGFGIFQLTNPKPTCSQIWSWKENVKAGIDLLETKRNASIAWMTSQRQAATSAVPKHSEGNCVFQDGTSKTIEDAVTIKNYNGASSNNQTCKDKNGCKKNKACPKCGNYCAWDTVNEEWRFNLENNLGFNYVQRVCNRVPKV